MSTILRKGYTTKQGVVVRPTMVRNMGKPGKGFPGRGIGKLKSGELSKYGYSGVTALTKRRRHIALNKALRGMVYGKGMSVRSALGTLIRKLNAIYVYTKLTSPRSSNIFRVDRDWLREKLRNLK